ncbi:hypothetical protein [Streptomyces gilvosporeus]|uniref:Integral membrane protein n=1 Tax=Streptomyces gilvosporeus TaxID=553510 RepID=A0A1V0TLK4_9ACTN|nr:hypothetical protein [Streptomyces gilvosporeus]ARF53750.1 hypothetical protein B1H19_05785 [Streptomyces gilvosporeus]
MDSSSPAAPEGAQGPLSAAERAEYARLRRAAAVRHRRLRYAATSVLLVLAFVLAPLGVVASWLDSQIANTDRYVQTVAPLARNPAVQDAVTNRVTTKVVSYIDTAKVTDALKRALQKTGTPPAVVDKADLLAGALKSGATSAVHAVANKVVTSDQFADVWNAANRRAHAAVVNVLTGKGGSAVEAKGNTISLNIGTAIDQVQKKLVDEGFKRADKIPDINKTVVLVKTDKLNKAQNAMRLLGIVGVWLPVLVVGLAALAVWSGPSHRIAMMSAAAGIGVMMVVLLVALAFSRAKYLDSVGPRVQSPQAAAAVYDDLVRFLQQSTRTVLVLSVIILIAGYLYGPGRGARWIRSVTLRGTECAGRGLARGGLRTNGPGRWLDGHRGWTTGIVIGAGVLALLLWNFPTPGVVALVLGIVVFVLLLLGILAAGRTAPVPPGPGPGPPVGDGG